MGGDGDTVPRNKVSLSTSNTPGRSHDEAEVIRRTREPWNTAMEMEMEMGWGWDGDGMGMEMEMGMEMTIVMEMGERDLDGDGGWSYNSRPSLHEHRVKDTIPDLTKAHGSFHLCLEVGEQLQQNHSQRKYVTFR